MREWRGEVGLCRRGADVKAASISGVCVSDRRWQRHEA